MMRFLKWFWLVMLAVIMILPMSGLAEEDIAVKSISFAAKSLTVMTGETTEPVEYTVNPENATNKNVIWSSEDETVAVVDQSGKVTGIKAGKTRILAAAENAAKGFRPAALNVVVIQPVTSITFDTDEIKLAAGTRAKINAAVLPEDATNKKLTWATSDKEIVQVSANGEITGRNLGAATVTCEAADGNGVSATVQVTVFKPVQNIKLDKTQMTAYVGKTSDAIVATVNPADAEYQGLIWTSSDESIATVNEKGQVTGVACGRVKITATSAEPVNGKQTPKAVTCQVQVVQAVEYIALSEKKETNRALYLEYTVYPDTATDRRVIWTTSNKKVATVANGVVKIKKKEGTATITATAKDGSGIYASCDITVSFSGSIIRIGSFEQRAGTYVWHVSNFTGNGVMPTETRTDLVPEQWLETGLGQYLPKPQLQSGEEPELKNIADSDTSFDAYVVNFKADDFDTYLSLIVLYGYQIQERSDHHFVATNSEGYKVTGTYTQSDGGFLVDGIPGILFEALEVYCEAPATGS